jgi:hypothetical protein
MTITYNPSLLANLNNPTTAVTTINNNETAVSSAFQLALNAGGDSMVGTLNMNNQQIINLPPPASQNSPARLIDVTGTTQTTVLAANITGVAAFSLIGNNTQFAGPAQAIPISGTGNVVLTNTPTISNIVLNGGMFVNSQVTGQVLLEASQTSSTYTFILPAVSASVGQLVNIPSSSAANSYQMGYVSPSQLKGTVAGDNAAAGNIGEYLTALGAATPLVTGTFTTVTSLTLTPGDWDVQAQGIFAYVNTVAATAFCGLSSITGVNQFAGFNFGSTEYAGMTINGQNVLVTGSARLNITVAQTIYCVCFASFNTSCSATGAIRARRVR